MRRDRFAFAAVEIHDLNGESGPPDYPIHQGLEADLVDFRSDHVYSCRAILLDGHGEEGFVLSRVKFHPGACQQL